LAFSLYITDGQPRPVPILTEFCYDKFSERL